MQNGRVVISALKRLRNPATAREVAKNIDQLAKVGVRNLMPTIQATLLGGVEHGFLRQKNRRFFVCDGDPLTEATLRRDMMKKAAAKRKDGPTIPKAVKTIKRTPARKVVASRTRRSNAKCEEWDPTPYLLPPAKSHGRRKRQANRKSLGGKSRRRTGRPRKQTASTRRAIAMAKYKRDWRRLTSVKPAIRVSGLSRFIHVRPSNGTICIPYGMRIIRV